MSQNLNIKDQLLSWSKKTFKTYSKIATSDKNYDLAFYQQSPLKDISSNVEVIVMGINPGSGGSFSDMRKNESEWALNSIEAENNHLLKGNIKWSERSRWRFIQNTRNLLSMINLVEDKDVVYTNSTFFNTPKACQLMDGLIRKTFPLTLELIKILSPKIVLCLSGKECFNHMLQIDHSKICYCNVFGNALLLGEHEGTKYVGIYHPAYYYSSALTQFIKKAIKIVYVNNEMDYISLTKKICQECEQDIERVKEHVPSTKVSFIIAQSVLENMMKFNRYTIIDSTDKTLSFGIGNLIKVCIVAQKNNQYIYWRHIDFNNRRLYDNPNQRYPLSDKIRAILKKYKFTDLDAKTALAKKPMEEYGVTSEEIVKNLSEEIILIGNEIEPLIFKPCSVN